MATRLQTHNLTNRHRPVCQKAAAHCGGNLHRKFRKPARDTGWLFFLGASAVPGLCSSVHMQMLPAAQVRDDLGELLSGRPSGGLSWNHGRQDHGHLIHAGLLEDGAIAADLHASADCGPRGFEEEVQPFWLCAHSFLRRHGNQVIPCLNAIAVLELRTVVNEPIRGLGFVGHVIGQSDNKIFARPNRLDHRGSLGEVGHLLVKEIAGLPSRELAQLHQQGVCRQHETAEKRGSYRELHAQGTGQLLCPIQALGRETRAVKCRHQPMGKPALEFLEFCVRLFQDDFFVFVKIFDLANQKKSMLRIGHYRARTGPESLDSGCKYATKYFIRVDGACQC